MNYSWRSGPINVQSEVCCDVCDEVMHNHIDCPVCEKKNVPTSSYWDLDADKAYTGNDICIILCLNCNVKFWTDANPYASETIWKLYED